MLAIKKGELLNKFSATLIQKSHNYGMKKNIFKHFIVNNIVSFRKYIK